MSALLRALDGGEDVRCRSDGRHPNRAGPPGRAERPAGQKRWVLRLNEDDTGSRSSAAFRRLAATARAFLAMTAAFARKKLGIELRLSSDCAAHCASSSAALAAARLWLLSLLPLAPSTDSAEATYDRGGQLRSALSFNFSATRIIARAASREAVTAASRA